MRMGLGSTVQLFSIISKLIKSFGVLWIYVRAGWAYTGDSQMLMCAP